MAKFTTIEWLMATFDTPLKIREEKIALPHEKSVHPTGCATSLKQANNKSIEELVVAHVRRIA